MVRGESTQTKVHHRANGEDFIVFVDDVEAYNKFKGGDTSIPLSHFMSNFTIYTTHKQGAQGKYDSATDQILDTAFPDQKDNDKKILEILDKGNFQDMEMPARQGPKNDSMGPMKSH